MYLQIPAVVMTRFGPWFGREVARRPGLLPTVIAKLRNGGAVLGDKVSDVISYVKKNPVSAAFTLATIASAGVAVQDLFDGVEIDDPNVRGLVKGLATTAATATPEQMAAANRRILAAGAASEFLKDQKSEEEKVKELAEIEILRWARSHYGSVKAALDAHRLHQAFFELSYDDVVHDFSTKRV